jgi:hypothetical protein
LSGLAVSFVHLSVGNRLLIIYDISLIGPLIISRIGMCVIVLAESRAVRDGGLRFIRDRDRISKAHVTAGESYVLVVRNLKASRCGRILWLP